MKKDIRPYLKDILESIEKIEEYTKAIKEKNFKNIEKNRIKEEIYESSLF